jgi:hypothetical protein
MARVPTCKGNTRVKDGLSGTWLQDCGPDFGEEALAEFFGLWRLLANAQLIPEQDDVLVWRWSEDGTFSAKSAYNVFFAGMTSAPTASQVWRSRAPYGCKFFMWTASWDHRWTADRLLRRRLPHPAACPLCDQARIHPAPAH